MRTQGQPPMPINNLHELNLAMAKLNPPNTGISVSQLEVKGASLPMLDLEIRANPTTLYNGMKRADVLQALKPGLAARVQTHPITYAYDTHGDKHFEGGPQGTKFQGAKTVVNPFLVQKIAHELGRIRRHANGQKQTYYLSDAPNQYTNGQAMAIQVDYEVSPAEKITYHGYPRDVTAYVLSTSLGGAPIP